MSDPSRPDKTLLIVGLGNPGEKYADTRHNVGFLVVEALAKAWDTSFSLKKKFKTDIAETITPDGKRILVKPTTYMNKSGEAVQAVMSWQKPGKTIVVHDDADLALGDIRVKDSGGSAGHNGINSLFEHIGQDFVRVRIGIGRSENEHIPLEDWVLGKWNMEERERLPEVIESAVEIILEVCDPAYSGRSSLHV